MLRDLKCEEFVNKVASKEPAPGGGAVVSLTGALGTALNAMVCNITINKKNLSPEDLEFGRMVLERTLKVQNKMMELIDKDAESYMTLSRAYGLPRSNDEEKEKRFMAIQASLLIAVNPPIEMLDLCIEAISLHWEMLGKCSNMIVSDIGVGVQCLKAAVLSTRLNILINANSIKNEKLKATVLHGVEDKVNNAVKDCDDIYAEVLKRI